MREEKEGKLQTIGVGVNVGSHSKEIAMRYRLESKAVKECEIPLQL